MVPSRLRGQVFVQLEQVHQTSDTSSLLRFVAIEQAFTVHLVVLLQLVAMLGLQVAIQGELIEHALGEQKDLPHPAVALKHKFGKVHLHCLADNGRGWADPVFSFR